MVTIKEFIEVYEQFAPKKLVLGSDPTGLHFGHPDQKITNVMTTLDVRPEVVQEAIDQGVDFILAHHPPVFKPVKNFDESDPQTKMYTDIIRHNIGVYASHTNLDVTQGGLNDWLAEALKLENTEILAHTYTRSHYKVAVFVPNEDSKSVLEACHEAGAGQVGDYSDVSYALQGQGRFTPSEDADPTIGSNGQTETVEEERLEFLVDENDLDAVVAAIQTAHPYEEPVYDIVKLERAGVKEGIGRIGNLEKEMTLEELLDHVKEAFNLEGLRYVLPPNNNQRTYQRIAICSGDGSSFVPDAIQSDADVYITGDVYYHTAHDLQAAGMTVIDPGHNIESMCIPKLAELVKAWSDENQWQLEVLESQTSTEPFKFY